MAARIVPAALAALLFATGCGPTCDRTPEVAPTRYTDGITDLDAGVYETSPLEGPYLEFPAGRTYLLVHGLGSRPRVVVAYLSFDEFPLPGPNNPTGESSNVAQAAGNQTLFEEWNAEHIRIRNDTCSEAFLRVVASEPEP